MKKENTYILNLDASYILRDYYTNGTEVMLDINKLQKCFTATIPYSLETIRLKKYSNFIYCNKNEQEKTIYIINVTFNQNLKLWDKKKKEFQIIKKDELRECLYKNGFKIRISGNFAYTYIMYKRGASKAKTGSSLFINERFYNTFKNRSRLGLNFEENEEMDLTSVYAYESLILSGLIDTIEIDPSQILIIDDIYGQKFKTTASVTRETNKQLVTKDEEIEIQNCLTDGMGLLDESYFNNYASRKMFIEKIEKLKNNKCRKKVIFKKANKKYTLSNSIKSKKTMLLLRNDWFKCNAVNTKLHKFLEQYAENGKVKDMFGRKRDIKTVDLVITPNSLKWLKLKDKFESKSKEECYDYWVKKIDKIFGIVKTDKIGNFADCNRTTYQLLNSMQLTKTEIKELVKEEIDYVNMLKNDIDVFKMHIGNDLTALEIIEALENKKKLDTSDMMSDLLAINHNFSKTRKFKTWRKAQIEQYLENLKKGKLRLSNTRYTTIISNPYAMLQAVVGEYKEGECVESGHVVWCNSFKKGQEFCISRNPHINAGNVMYATNKYYKEYEWFNLSGNMCVINANDTDVLDRLQGCDVDSDAILMLTHPILIKHAKENRKYLTPINKVKGKKELKKNNMMELAKLDDMLQNNLIGEIINTSALYNAYMSKAIYDNADEYTIQRLYNASSMLSSLSQIELDRSKKSFPNIDMKKELPRIKNLTDKNDNTLIKKESGYIYKNVRCFDIKREIPAYVKNQKRKNIKEDFKYNSIINKHKIKIIKKKWYSLEEYKAKNDPKKTKKKTYKIKTPYSIISEYYVKDEILLCKTRIYKKVKDVKKVNKTVVPNFFNVVAENTQYRIYEDFPIAMDYLQEILQTEINRKQKTQDIEFKKIIEPAKNVSGCNVNKEQIEKIKTIVEKYGKALNILKCKECTISSESKPVYKRNRKNEALEKLTYKVNAKTILYILKECYCKNKTEWSKYAMYATNLLYIRYKKEFLECFKTEWNDKEMVLIRDKNGSIKVWNKNYKKITKKEYIKMKKIGA